MNDNLKVALNIMQSYIVPEYESDNVLYIFDNKEQLERYKQKMIKEHKNTPDKILKTIDDLSNGFTGLRFKRYWFMTDRDI